MPDVLVHFSEDPTIQCFVPHVPATNPLERPAVWAIDEPHAPLCWFPRDCPRVTVWARTPWPSASGQWISRRTVEPVEVSTVGDLLSAHVAAMIDLRLVATLWPIYDQAISDEWGFSIVRMAKAQPRRHLAGSN